MCGAVNEHREAFISSCSECGKYFAPFYFFEESDFKGVQDNGLHLTIWKMRQGYHPLWGFSTYWEEE